MTPSDDLQRTWQQIDSEEEEHRMWMQLVKEKRRGFDELVRAENQAQYLVSGILGPLMALFAWQARFAWVRVGYGVLAAAMFAAAAATWLADRPEPRLNELSLRERLESLLRSYERRLRFLRHIHTLVALPLVAGFAGVIFGLPGAGDNPWAWVAIAFVLLGVGPAMGWSYRCTAARIRRKRAEAEDLLRPLQSE